MILRGSSLIPSPVIHASPKIIIITLLIYKLQSMPLGKWEQKTPLLGIVAKSHPSLAAHVWFGDSLVIERVQHSRDGAATIHSSSQAKWRRSHCLDIIFSGWAASRVFIVVEFPSQKLISSTSNNNNNIARRRNSRAVEAHQSPSPNK